MAAKLIVRRLPPSLTAEEFAAAADPKGADKAIWRSFYSGSVESTGSVKRTAQVVRHSVAYLAFAKMEDAAQFNSEFNGFKFIETGRMNGKTNDNSSLQTGSDYYARIERAMWQTVPPLGRRRHPPPIEGTIESDPDYLRFLKNLEADAQHNAGSSVSGGPSSSAFPSTLSDKSESQSEKVGGQAPAKAEVITSLMEDVRARRRERDEKKKTSKPPLRAPRGKARHHAVVDSPETPEPVSKAAVRRKKRRGGEFQNGSKAPADTQSQRRNTPTKQPPIARRAGPVPRREEGNARPERSTVPARKGPPYPTNGTIPNGGGATVKGNVRGPPPRQRYGRGPRPKGKPNAPQNGVTRSPGRVDHPGISDDTQGSVRLLKKEASNGSKT